MLNQLSWAADKGRSSTSEIECGSRVFTVKVRKLQRAPDFAGFTVAFMDTITNIRVR